MQYFHLNKDVFVVDGYARSAIYDLNQENLYSIGSKLKKIIAKAMQGLNEQELLVEERELIQQLVQEKVLIPANSPGVFLDIKKELKKNYPVKFAYIEVTRQCNMTCTFCYEESTPHCHERLELSDFKKVLDNLIDTGIKEIQFIGGEPLILRNELKEMISMARPYMNFIEIYTNGILINKDWCEFFKKYNINIAISMHSYMPEEHDKIVNLKGAHKKLTKAYYLMRQYDIQPRIAGIKNKEIKRGQKSEEFPIQIRFDNPRLTGRADVSQYDFEMFKTKAITKEKKKSPLTRKQVSLHVNAHQCFSKDVYIATDLTVYPCVMERRVNYGNLKEQKLEDLIQNPFRQLTKDEIEGCKDCEYRYACFDCRPDANGRGVYQKPWFCTYNPNQGQWIDLDIAFSALKKHSKLANIPIVTE